jgi:hypothetical protein
MPAMSPQHPLTKQEWLNAFRTEAERLRELYVSKLVAAVALQEWVKHRDEDPVKSRRRGPRGAEEFRALTHHSSGRPGVLRKAFD